MILIWMTAWSVAWNRFGHIWKQEFRSCIFHRASRSVFQRSNLAKHLGLCPSALVIPTSKYGVAPNSSSRVSSKYSISSIHYWDLLRIFLTSTSVIVNLWLSLKHFVFFLAQTRSRQITHPTETLHPSPRNASQLHDARQDSHAADTG